jgi:phenylacetate-CoA ligase
MRDNYPYGLFAVPLEQIVRIHASSGTTGKPTVVGYTRRDIETWTELMARSFAAAGAHKGDVIHNAYGYGLCSPVDWVPITVPSGSVHR